MPRKKTSRVSPTRPSGERQINLRVRTRRIMWSRTKQAGTRLAKILCVLAILAAGAWAGKEALRQVFLENDEFFLQQVQLQQWDSGESPELLDEARLKAVTNLDEGSSIFAFHLGDLQKRLEALPEVKRARATRRLPNVLRVNIEERVPMAWIDCPKKGIVARNYRRGLLVDASGYCFNAHEAMRAKVDDLPVIAASAREAGPLKSGQILTMREMLRALELVKLSHRLLNDTGWSLPVVGLNNEYSLMAKTNLGTSVVFGLYEHERQLDDLLMILDHARQSGQGVEWMNLIPERNIPVVFTGSDRAMAMTPTAVETELEEILKRG